MLINELTGILGEPVMRNAYDVSWQRDLAHDQIIISLTRKLDRAVGRFVLPWRPSGSPNAPGLDLSEETKAMLVLFLCS